MCWLLYRVLSWLLFISFFPNNLVSVLCVSFRQWNVFHRRVLTQLARSRALKGVIVMSSACMWYMANICIHDGMKLQIKRHEKVYTYHLDINSSTSSTRSNRNFYSLNCISYFFIKWHVRQCDGSGSGKEEKNFRM